MAFLFQDQNQGIRNDEPTRMRGPTRPFSFIRTLTVGFGVTPNLLTLLPKESPQAIPGEISEKKKALAGLGYLTLTAGGEFHPALRTSAARDERPEIKYGEGRLCQQEPSPWGKRMSPCPNQRLRRGQSGRWPRASTAPDSDAANPIPVCSHCKS
jgi:hypothetical protein